MTVHEPHFLLRGIAGSTAHGLATADSDEDLHGVFAWPSEAFQGLLDPPESLTGHEPQDFSYHELKKFLKLALKSNPTVLELLWLRSYVEIDDVWGAWLVEMRTSFLSARPVHSAYLGYAHSQFAKLQRRGESFSSDTNKRTSKHARHLFRLLEQGQDLMATGDMSIKVKDRQRYFDIADMSPEQWTKMFEQEVPKFEEAFRNTVLPAEPDTDLIDAFLHDYREQH